MRGKNQMTKQTNLGGSFTLANTSGEHTIRTPPKVLR